MKSRVHPLTFILPPGLATFLLWVTANQEIAVDSLILSSLLLFFAWASFERWVHRLEFNFPLLSAILGLHWLYFMLPLFLGDDTVLMYQFMDVVLSPEAIRMSLWLVTLGLSFLWLGFASGVGRRLSPTTLPDLQESEGALRWTRILLLVGILAHLVESASVVGGSGLRQLVLVLQNTVPLVAFAILLRRWFHGEANRQDKVLMAGYLIIRVLVGMASGWLGAVVGVLVVVGVIYLGERRRLPIGVVAVFLLVFMFLQAGKEDFRREYWRANVNAGRMDRISAWVESSIDAWREAFADESGDLLRRRTLRVLARVSLLPQTANVLELTPKVVPFQGLKLYSYMAVTLIPRFLWPNKPSINEANQFYQVAYGLTTEENLDTVSISVGYLTEGYISWGWTGTCVVMFLMGIFYDLFQNTFLSKNKGLFAQALGAALIFQLTSIEGQFAQYLGGLLQQILVVILVFLPVMTLREEPARESELERRSPEREFEVEQTPITNPS